MKALIVTADSPWRSKYANALLDCACNVHTTTDGFEAIELLRKHTYQIVVFDSSIRDISPLEFNLALRDIRGRNPHVLVAAPDYADKFARLGPAATVEFIGGPDELLKRIPATVTEAKTDGQRHARAN